MPLDQSAHPTTESVAVICCFLNGREFLGEAIESVLAQDYPNLTLILVDDGSTDGASDLARRFAEHDPRVEYVEHEGHANKGLSASRNLGISLSGSFYVAFIDADDVWVPNKLTDQVGIMRANPGLAMVCGAANYWSSWSGGEDCVIVSGHASNRRIDPPEALLAVYPLGRAAAPPPSDLLVRRDVLEQLGGFEEHFRGIYALYEDQAFLTKLYLAAPVWFSDKVWLFYRQHPGSIVASVKAQGRYHDVRRYFLQWFRRYLAAKPTVDPRVRSALAKALWPYRIPGAPWLLRVQPHRHVGAAIERLGKRVLRKIRRRVSSRPTGN